MMRLQRTAVLGLIAALVPGLALADDWRSKVGTFRIGIVAPQGLLAIEGAEQIETAFSGLLSMPVEVVAMPDFPALIDAQASGRLEYAVYTASAFAMARDMCSCVRAIAAPVSADGAEGYRYVVIARSGSGANAKTIAVPPEGLPGRPGEIAPPEWTVTPAQSAEAAETMFRDGSVGALLGWIPATKKADDDAGGTPARLAQNGMKAGDVAIRWRSDFIPNGPHAIRSELGSEPADLIASFLAGLRDKDRDVYDAIEAERGGGFRRVSNGEYANPVLSAPSK